MARSLFSVVALAVASLLFTGCYVAPVMPPPGLLFQSVEAPIDTDAQGNTIGSRVGESSSMSVLGLIASGDASVSTAARKGGITRIDHVDYKYLHILLIYHQFTTKVYGE